MNIFVLIFAISNIGLKVPDFFPAKPFLLLQRAASNDLSQQVLGTRFYLHHKNLK